MDVGRVRCALCVGEMACARGTPGWFCPRLPGGHGEVLRVGRGDAAGTAAGLLLRRARNSEHGNRSGPHPDPRSQRGCLGLGPSSADRVGTGRSRRSTARPGEPVTSGSCAVSLGVGSLSQRVEVRKEEASGSPTSPGRESARGQQHGGKAWSVVKALMALPRKARVIWRRPDCLKPSSQ